MPKIDAQRLGVANVQIAVGLRRKARMYAVEPAGFQILVDKFLNKIRSALFFRHGELSFPHDKGHYST